MARIRTIKPDFFHHDGLAELSAYHRLLFIGLWTLADRQGRMLDRPRRLKAAIFPYELTDEQFDEMLWDLAEHREQFIIRYEVDGVPYLSVPSFPEHQRPHPKDAESIIPPVTDDSVRSRIPRVFPGKSTEVHGKKLTVEHASGEPPDAPLSNTPLSKSPRIQESKTRARASRMVPREFGLTDERRAFAEANGVDPGGEFAKFQDHEFKTAHVDWDKAWRNWVRRSLELRANGRRSGRTTAEVLREIRAAEEKKSNAG